MISETREQLGPDHSLEHWVLYVIFVLDINLLSYVDIRLVGWLVVLGLTAL